MLPVEILARYDHEMRRDPVPDAGSRVERAGSVVRVVGESNCILWADLTPANLERVIAEQADFFRHAGAVVEWKTFGHDRPEALEAMLARAGFVAGAPETLVAFDLRDGPPSGPLPAGFEVRRATDEVGVRDAVAATEAAFGSDDATVSARYRAVLRDARQALWVVYAQGRAVSAGRIEMPLGRSFAYLWGGGTAPEFRHRGIYRGLVHVRGVVARNAGYRFLLVDAEETSRPILERLGFLRLTTTRAWTLRPEASDPGEHRSVR
jgi:ribosomal protein S18 acetylase RimI-like enzyme